jgi:shikimate kinase
MIQLILIGSRGAGKTAVGRAVSARLGRPFADLDDRAIALAGGGSIRDFMARAGEPAWRDIERRAFLDATGGPERPAVLALGGGAVTVAAIRDGLDLLRESGSVRIVWLSTPVELLAARLQAAPGDRGSLTGLGLIDELPALLAVREPLYRGLSNVAFDTAGRSVAEVADTVVAWFATSKAVS